MTDALIKELAEYRVKAIRGSDDVAGFDASVEAEIETIRADDRTRRALELLDEMAGVLETAQNGLKWYLGEYPDYKSPADDEMHEAIDAVLEKYRLCADAKQQKGE